jgi:nitroreductase
VSGDLILHLARSRLPTRHFKSDPIPEKELKGILEAARFAPSGFNLDPIHYVVVTQADTRKKLARACFQQYQVTEAPVLIVLTADRRCVRHNLSRVVDGLKLSAEAEERLRRVVRMNFEQGACGLIWLAKLVGGFLFHPFTPMPLFPAIHKRSWLAKQAGLAAANILLAAEGFGLGTAILENFDESRVRHALKIPRYHTVPMIIALGWPENKNHVQFRLPAADKVHNEEW